MNYKVNSISFNKIFINKLNINNNKYLNKNMKVLSKTEVLPIVSIPLVAYIQSLTTQHNLDKNLATEAIKKANNRYATDPVTDRTDKNIKLLKKCGLKESDAKKYLKADGYMDKEGKNICKNNGITGFKGSPQDDIYQEHGMEYGIDTESNTTLAIQGDLDANYALTDSQLSESFDKLIELAENPVLEGVLAEMLPGTKFLKPGKDLLDGDYEKAAIGITSRGVEILVAPVKIGWSLFGAAAGGISWLAGNRGEGTGLIGGFKHASQMWARGRNKTENYIIDRKEVDLDAQQIKMRMAYEASTQKEINRIRTQNLQEIKEIKSNYAEADEQAESEKLKTQRIYERKQEINSEIRDKSNSRISKNNANQENLKQHLRQLIEDREYNFKYQQKMISKLGEEIKAAQRECNTTLAHELEKQKALIEKEYKRQSQAVLSSIKEILEVSKQYESIYKKNDAEGFKSVAGYEGTKKQLAMIFGVPLVQSITNKKVNVPNVIALYGPKGSGKTLLGTSLAKQFDCIDGGSLLLKEGDDINFARLMKLAQEAKSNYKRTGKRTIIQIDEVEYFGTKQSSSFWKNITGKPQNFSEFLSVCSNKYGCSLIVTTNEPEKIDKSIKSKMIPLYVPPASTEDIALILKYYVNNRNNGLIDYDSLANMLAYKTQNGEAFSNARLENIVQTVISRYGTITQKYLENEIVSREPDISKKEIDFYQKGF